MLLENVGIMYCSTAMSGLRKQLKRNISRTPLCDEPSQKNHLNSRGNKGDNTYTPPISDIYKFSSLPNEGPKSNSYFSSHLKLVPCIFYFREHELCKWLKVELFLSCTSRIISLSSIRVSKEVVYTQG